MKASLAKPSWEANDKKKQQVGENVGMDVNDAEMLGEHEVLIRQPAAVRSWAESADV